MLPRDVRGRPWAKVGATLFELQGQHYLLLVDYFSILFQLMRLSLNMRMKRVIDAMMSQFARHGPQFFLRTVKNLVNKTMEDGSDVLRALLNFRNTVREG